MKSCSHGGEAFVSSQANKVRMFAKLQSEWWMLQTAPLAVTSMNHLLHNDIICSRTLTYQIHFGKDGLSVVTMHSVTWSARTAAASAWSFRTDPFSRYLRRFDLCFLWLWRKWIFPSSESLSRLVRDGVSDVFWARLDCKECNDDPDRWSGSWWTYPYITETLKRQGGRESFFGAQDKESIIYMYLWLQIYRSGHCFWSTWYID